MKCHSTNLFCDRRGGVWVVKSIPLIQPHLSPGDLARQVARPIVTDPEWQILVWTLSDGPRSRPRMVDLRLQTWSAERTVMCLGWQTQWRKSVSL